MKKRIILASTVALSFAPVLATQAEELVWTARSVEQIQNDVTKNENKTSYTIQYGDTLSTIAEALGVDVTVLANLNKISNIDLIFPETVLTTTVNDEEEVTEVEIQTPDTVQGGEGTIATADLTTNQVTVDDQTIQVEDLTQPVEETESQVEAVAPQATEEAVAEVTTEVVTPAEEPVAEATTETVAEVASPVVENSTPVVEETAVETATSSSDTEDVTYQAEPSQHSSNTYAAPAAPDYAGLAAVKSENAGLQPQTAAFKRLPAKQNMIQ